jgi:hypothetical protein
MGFFVSVRIAYSIETSDRFLAVISRSRMSQTGRKLHRRRTIAVLGQMTGPDPIRPLTSGGVTASGLPAYDKCLDFLAAAPIALPCGVGGREPYQCR